MRSIFACLILLLLLSSSAFSDDRDVPWLVSWPFFQNVSPPHSINGGYGDWCIKSEGAHPGLDFGAEPDSLVLLPTNDTRYTLGTYSGLGYTMVFGLDPASQDGWGIAHLAIDTPAIWPYLTGSVVSNHQPLAPCSLYNVSAPLHMHLQWVGLPPASPPGLHNPFDFFEDSLANYDEVQFNHVKWEEFLSPPGNRGIWFTADHHETYDQLGQAF